MSRPFCRAAPVCDNGGMATYRIEEFHRDGLSGWIVESSTPRDRNRPRRLYKTSSDAQAEADRLTAAEAAAGEPATADRAPAATADRAPAAAHEP